MARRYMGRYIAGSIFLAIILLISLLYPAPSFSAGNDIKLKTNLLQNEFKDLSREIGLVISYVPLAPAEPLGTIGFDLGVEVTAARISSGDPFWKKAVADQSPPDYIVIPRIHVQKGLPLGIDIGAIFSTVPGSNVTLYGGEIKWAMIRGGVIYPAVAVRGTFTTLTGVDDIDATTYSIDASISKGFGPVTPYAGVGEIWVSTSENVSGLNLNDVNTGMGKFFLGTRISMLFVNIVLEADFSEIPLYSVRANIGL